MSLHSSIASPPVVFDQREHRGLDELARVLAGVGGGHESNGCGSCASCQHSATRASADRKLEQGTSSSKASRASAEASIDREAGLELDLRALLGSLGATQLLAMVLKLLRVVQAPMLVYSAATLVVIFLGWLPLFLALEALFAWRLGRAVLLRSERFELRRRLVAFAIVSCALAISLASHGHLWPSGEGQSRR